MVINPQTTNNCFLAARALADDDSSPASQVPLLTSNKKKSKLFANKRIRQLITKSKTSWEQKWPHLMQMGKHISTSLDGLKQVSQQDLAAYSSLSSRLENRNPRATSCRVADDFCTWKSGFLHHLTYFLKSALHHAALTLNNAKVLEMCKSHCSIPLSSCFV